MAFDMLICMCCFVSGEQFVNLWSQAAATCECYSEHYARVVQLEFSRTVGYTEYSCLYTDVNIAASRNSSYMLCTLLQHVSAVA